MSKEKLQDYLKSLEEERTERERFGPDASRIKKALSASKQLAKTYLILYSLKEKGTTHLPQLKLLKEIEFTSTQYARTMLAELDKLNIIEKRKNGRDGIVILKHDQLTAEHAETALKSTAK